MMATEHKGNPRNTCVDLDPINFHAPSEKDPQGLMPNSPGAKLDAGKIMVDDILSGFPRSLMAISEVGTFGAKKYTLNGWQSVDEGIRRYRNAAGRHRLKIQMGETHDSDSGMPHRYHEAWNVLASLELEMRKDEESS